MFLNELSFSTEKSEKLSKESYQDIIKLKLAVLTVKEQIREIQDLGEDLQQLGLFAETRTNNLVNLGGDKGYSCLSNDCVVVEIDNPYKEHARLVKSTFSRVPFRKPLVQSQTRSRYGFRRSPHPISTQFSNERSPVTLSWTSSYLFNR